MDVTLHIDRLYEDESLVDNLASSDARVVLAWAERLIESYRSDAEVDRLMATLRRINRMVGNGLPFSRILPLLQHPSQSPPQ